MLCPALCSALSRHLIFPENPCGTGGFVPFPQTTLSAPKETWRLFVQGEPREQHSQGQGPDAHAPLA